MGTPGLTVDYTSTDPLWVDCLLIGTVFVPWHYGSELGIGAGKPANRVTIVVYGVHFKQPEYNFSAMRIARAAHGGEGGLP